MAANDRIWVINRSPEERKLLVNFYWRKGRGEEYNFKDFGLKEHVVGDYHTASAYFGRTIRLNFDQVDHNFPFPDISSN